MRVEEWISKNLTSDDEVLITGSSSGIGYEYARRFSAAKCRLVCISNEGQTLVRQKAVFEAEFGNHIDVIEHDFRDVEGTKQLAKRLAVRPIKVLINNAGFGLKGRFEANLVEEYIDIVAVNVTAPMILARAIVPKMQEANVGLVFHIASINALVPIPNNQVYTATKAFSASYASALARENKNSGLRFQLVLPGTTRTPFHDRQGVQPQKLVMLPEEVVRKSLDNINIDRCIPNRADRLFAKILPFIPRNVAIDLAGLVLKKRLGL